MQSRLVRNSESQLDIQSDTSLRQQAIRLGFPETRLPIALTPRNRGHVQDFISLAEVNARASFRFVEVSTRRTRGFSSGQYTFRIEERKGEEYQPLVRESVDVFISLQQRLENLVERMKAYVIHLRFLRDSDRMQFIFMDGMRRFATEMLRVSDLTPQGIIDRLVGALSSDEEFNFENMRIQISYVKRIGGLGGSYTCEGDDFARRKTCIYYVDNEAHGCFYVSLAIALWKEECDFLKESANLCKGKSHQVHQRRQRAARVVYEKLKEELKDEVLLDFEDDVTLEQINTFGDVLGHEILVVDYETLKVLNKPNEGLSDNRWVAVLYVRDEDEDRGPGHYHAINKEKMGALWSRRKFCIKCCKGFSEKSHKCYKLCTACRNPLCKGGGKNIETFKIPCLTCNLSYYDEDCLAYHICGTYMKCLKCKRIYTLTDSRDKHFCNRRKCYNCKKYVKMSEQHKCYHQKLKEPAFREKKYIYYDYETCQDEEGYHKPTLIVAEYNFKDEQKIFYTTEEFLKWVLRPMHKNFTLVAHNGAKYDAHFIKKCCIENHIPTEDLINANAILFMKTSRYKIRVIDSYRFLPFALRMFSKTFRISTEKGHFPYRFYTEKNRGYKGKIPDKEYFEFHKLKTEKEKESALQWYNQYENKEYDIEEECLKYCKEDVHLLKQGCEMFRWSWIETTNMDPFQSITIASASMTVFRTKYLKENTIALLDTSCDSQFQKFLKEFELYKYDMYCEIDRQSKLMRCIDVGCEECFKPTTVNIANGEMMRNLKKKYSTQNIMKECEWARLRTLDEDVKQSLLQFGTLKIQKLDPREALYGGRTEVFRRHWKSDGTTKAYYDDFVSLYPSIQSGRVNEIVHNKHGKVDLYYPIGHPKVMKMSVNEFLSGKYFGFVKCHVKPPETLYFPVLPASVGGKLVFDLKERTGTWTTIEMYKAISRGYKITEILEVWHFEKKSKNLFREYVKGFMKLKYKATGWEKLDCYSPEDKKRFITDVKKHLDLDIKEEEMTTDVSPGLYQVSKLALNSLWGKFCQREYYQNSKDVFTAGELDELVFDETNIIEDVIFWDQRARTVKYRKRFGFQRPNRSTNVAIAAYTTSMARLRLLEALEAIEGRGNKVLYCDTDSVIWVSNGTQHPIKRSIMLGDLSSELDSGDWIEEFVGTAPKCYAYRTHKNEQCVKVKGITLHGGNTKIFNLETLKDLVYDKSKKLIDHPLQFKIDRHEIRTIPEYKKEVSGTFTKRKVCEDKIETKPWKKQRK